MNVRINQLKSQDKMTYQKNGELQGIYHQTKKISQIDKGISTHHSLNHLCEHMAFVSQIESKSINEALNYENWVTVMHDELNQCVRNNIWVLVPKFDYMNVIGTKWVFKNKLDKTGMITKNKVR